MKNPLDGVDLDQVRARISPHLNQTTLLASDALDEALGARVLVASETFQRTGSFKFRAAVSVALFTDAPHLITASSGNFGAALALAAKLTEKKCTVVMPHTSSAVKVASVKSYGAVVDIIDVSVTSRADRLAALVAENPGARSCSPYDDAFVIAGNATLGAEIFAVDTPDVIVAPVGGGGLSAGLVVARDAQPATTLVIGAEPQMASDAARSLEKGERVFNVAEPQTIADGARTLSLGVRNFEILKAGLSEIIEVSEDDIARAVRLLFTALHLQVEPTGALSVAALIANPAKFTGKRVVCIASGGNVDAAVYAKIITAR